MADAEQIRACPDGAVAERDRLAARMGVPMSGIAAFCDRWGVEELALFGSVLRDDFGPDSDIDVLVRFKAGRTPGFVRSRQDPAVPFHAAFRLRPVATPMSHPLRRTTTGPWFSDRSCLSVNILQSSSRALPLGSSAR